MNATPDERNRRVWGVLDDAYALPVDEREPFVRHALRDDPALADMVVRSLDENSGASSHATVSRPALDAIDALELVGQVLQDRYEVVEEAGRGGMGVVYRGRHLELDQPVAIKVLPSGRHMDEVVHEGRRIADVGHDSVVRVFDVGIHADTPFLVMEWLEGFDLRDWLSAAAADGSIAPLDDRFVEFARSRGASTELSSYWRFVATVMRDVARAVATAHGHGVVHQDVSPKNILFTTEGRATLVDFGLSTLLRAEGEFRHGGTLPYMAPEHRESRESRNLESNDVYGLGATLLHLLTGRSPDRVTLPARGFRRAVHFGGATTRGHAAPQDLLRIAWKAMQPDPADRYSSAAAFADDLDAFLGYRAISVGTPGMVRSLGLWWRRNPARAAATFLAPTAAIAIVLAARLHIVDAAERAAETRKLQDAERVDEANEIYARLPTLWGFNADPRLPFSISATESRETREALERILQLRPEFDSVRVRRAMIAARAGDLDTVKRDLDLLDQAHRDSSLLGPLRAVLMSGNAKVRHECLSPEEVVDCSTRIDHVIAATCCFLRRRGGVIDHAQAAIDGDPSDFATREIWVAWAGLTGKDHLPVVNGLNLVSAAVGGRETCTLLHVRAWRHWVREDPSTAIRLWTQSLEQNPDQYHPLVNRALRLLDRGESEGRLDEAERLLRDRPHVAATHELYMKCLRAEGRQEDATRTILESYRQWHPDAPGRDDVMEHLTSQIAHHELELAHADIALGTTSPNGVLEEATILLESIGGRGGSDVRAVRALRSYRRGLIDRGTALDAIEAEVAIKFGYTGEATHRSRAAYAAEAYLLAVCREPIEPDRLSFARTCHGVLHWNPLVHARAFDKFSAALDAAESTHSSAPATNR